MKKECTMSARQQITENFLSTMPAKKSYLSHVFMRKVISTEGVGGIKQKRGNSKLSFVNYKFLDMHHRFNLVKLDIYT